MVAWFGDFSQQYCFRSFVSGLGYVVGSKVAELAGEWQWGVRVTPFLNLLALILLVFFMVDPPRGNSKLSLKLSDDQVYFKVSMRKRPKNLDKMTPTTIRRATSPSKWNHGAVICGIYCETDPMCCQRWHSLVLPSAPELYPGGVLCS